MACAPDVAHQFLSRLQPANLSKAATAADSASLNILNSNQNSPHSHKFANRATSIGDAVVSNGDDVKSSVCNGLIISNGDDVKSSVGNVVTICNGDDVKSSVGNGVTICNGDDVKSSVGYGVIISNVDGVKSSVGNGVICSNGDEVKSSIGNGVISNGDVVKSSIGNGVYCNGDDVKSRVLIIGATGFIGRFVAEASVKSGRPTYALVRPNTSKQKVVQSLKESGVNILNGCLEDYTSLLKAIRQADVVISTVGGAHINEQQTIIDAIKEAGNIKRFLPSEFGHDVDQADPHEPALAFYISKRRIRRAVEAAKIPYTYVCCNSIAGWPYYYHTHPTELPPPSDRFEIYGDGNVKAFFVTGEDIGAYTMRSVDDPFTLNKSLHFRPPKNFLTLNEMATIWESKIHKSLPKSEITEEYLLEIARANIMPSSIVAALTHDIFINGCQFKFPLREPHDVEACQLYPDLQYTTIEDFFNTYI